MPSATLSLLRDTVRRMRRLPGLLALKVDALRFRSQRADYYAYLAHLLTDVDGRKTLHDVFDDDAYRYGRACVRGRLAAHWIERYRQTGGDLQGAWEDTLPTAEVNLLRAAQRAGSGALPATLSDLSRAARLIERTRTLLLTTTAAGVVALAVALAMLAAMPMFTVPKLQQVFQSVPADYYGAMTQRLWHVASVLRRFGVPLLAVSLMAVYLAVRSMPILVGRARSLLDRFSIWRLYRDVQCIRFMAMLAILLRQRSGVDARLREALVAQSEGATPWLASHLDLMVARLDAGNTGADVFDTGLIERETWWYLSDLIAARGFETALLLARDRVEVHVMRRVTLHAAALRWVLLLGSLTLILGLAFWHYAVIDELRRSMTQFYATP